MGNGFDTSAPNEVTEEPERIDLPEIPEVSADTEVPAWLSQGDANQTSQQAPQDIIPRNTPTDQQPQDQTNTKNKPATIRPRDNPETIETLPNPEKEGTTITLPDVKEEPLAPPKGWTPGGPEGKG